MSKLTRQENYSGSFKRKHYWYRYFGYGDGARHAAHEFHKILCRILKGEKVNLYITQLNHDDWISVVEFDDDYIAPLLILEFDRDENVDSF